jgi:WhiB family transcriptional regulator, redox-sensing transcriptional regulator
MPTRSDYGTSPRHLADWRESAACLGHHPEWWALDSKVLTRANLRAVDICQGCPVVDPCLDDAARAHDRHTIRGGLTPEKRERENRNARRRVSRDTTGAGRG